MIIEKMKKIISIVLILVMLLASVSAYAGSDVRDYLEYDDMSRKIVSKRIGDNVTSIDGAEIEFKKLSEGWYIVEESCTIGKAPAAPFTAGGVGISGDVHIVIGDEVTLTVLGGFGLDKYQGAEGSLFVHGVENGDCNLVIEGIAPDKTLAVDAINYAYGQGLSLDSFTVYGCNVVITAGDGAQGVAPLNADGKDGYTAVQNTRMNLYNSNVQVYGGNGGDSGAKRSFQGTNNGGNGGSALILSGVDLLGGTLELYGGKGGKNLIGSGHDGVSANAGYGSPIHADNATVWDPDTGESISLDDISSHQSVIIATQDLPVGSMIGAGMPIIVIAGLVVLVAAVLVVRKKAHEAK